MKNTITVAQLNLIRKSFMDLLDVVSPKDFNAMTEIIAKLNAMSNTSLRNWTISVRTNEQLVSLMADTTKWSDPNNLKIYDAQSHKLVSTLAETMKEYKADDTH